MSRAARSTGGALSRHAAVALVAVAAMLATGCSVFRSPSGNEPAKLVSIKNPEVQARSAWTERVGSGGDGAYSGLSPVFRRGVAYSAGARGTVTAVDVETGKTRWSVDTDYRFLGGPGWGGDVLLLGTRDGEVVALSTDNGSEVWSVEVSSEVLATPVRVDEVVVVRGGDGRIYGLSLESGKRRWVFERAAPALTLRGVSTPVALDARSALIGLDTGKLVVLNTVDGEAIYERTVREPSGRSELERIADVDTTILVDGENAYVGSYGGEVVAFSIPTGRELWRRELSTYTGFALDESGSLYLTTAEGDVMALDAASGAKIWETQALAYRGLTAPAVYKGNLVVGDAKGYVHFLSPADGQIIGRREVGGALRAAPQVYDGTLFVYSDSGELTALNAGPAGE